MAYELQNFCEDARASLRAKKLGAALDSLVQASDSVSRLSANLDRTLLAPDNNDRFQQLVRKTETALDEFSLAMGNITGAMVFQSAITTVVALTSPVSKSRSRDALNRIQ